MDPSMRLNEKDFTRERKLTLPMLIVFILHLVGAARTEGVDVEIGRFFRNAKRSGLWPQARTVHRSAVTKARKKVAWQMFRDILHKAVALAYELIPADSGNTWFGMPVLAIDGSKFNLPATAAIRAEFDPRSGLHGLSHSHYPQCLVSTLYDVFRRLPVARTVMPNDTSERDEAMELLAYALPGSIVLFDRGYPSYGLLLYLLEQCRAHFLMRCPATNTFPAVEAFIRSGEREAIIFIQPTQKFCNRQTALVREGLQPLKVRAIRMTDPEGKESVLLTDLLDTKTYGCDQIIALYFRRWNIEVQYRDEKVTMAVEQFHGKSSNSIRQELFAAAIVTVIARTMARLSENMHDQKAGTVQAKNALVALATEAAVLTPHDPAAALRIFEEILHDMARVKYYRPKKPRPPQPRVTKGNANKWQQGKTRKTIAP